MSLEISVRGRALTTKFSGRDLSRREWQVLTLTAQGLITKEIASILGKISPRTVEVQKESCMVKLGARTGAHAVAIAIRWHIIFLDTVIPEEEYKLQRRGRPKKLRDASIKGRGEVAENDWRLR